MEENPKWYNQTQDPTWKTGSTPSPTNEVLIIDNNF